MTTETIEQSKIEAKGDVFSTLPEEFKEIIREEEKESGALPSYFFAARVTDGHNIVKIIAHQKEKGQKSEDFFNLPKEQQTAVIPLIKEEPVGYSSSLRELLLRYNAKQRG